MCSEAMVRMLLGTEMNFFDERFEEPASWWAMYVYALRRASRSGVLADPQSLTENSKVWFSHSLLDNPSLSWIV